MPPQLASERKAEEPIYEAIATIVVDARDWDELCRLLDVLYFMPGRRGYYQIPEFVTTGEGQRRSVKIPAEFKRILKKRILIEMLFHPRFD